MKAKFFLVTAIVSLVFFGTSAQQWNWAKAAYGNGQHMSINSCTDKEGNTYAVGWFVDTLNFSDNISMAFHVIPGVTMWDNVFVVKYDRNGNAQWARQINASDSYETFFITCDALLNIYVAFTFSDSIALNNTYTLSRGENDVAIICFSSSGTILWHKYFGTAEKDLIRTLAPAADGFLMSGTLSETMRVDNTELIPQLGTPTDYLMRFNSSGQILWNELAFGATIDAVTVDKSENIFLAGRFSFSALIGDTVLFGSSNSPHLYCIRQSNSRNTQWINIASGNNFLRPSDIISDNRGSVYVCGGFMNDIYIDQCHLSCGSYSSFLFALDGNIGQCKWLKKNMAKWQHGTAGFRIKTDNSEAVYLLVSGNNWNFSGDEFLSSYNFEYSFLSRYKNDGSLLWTADLRNGQGVAANISIDDSSNFYVTGFFLKKGITFGNISIQKEHDMWEMFVARIDADKIITPSQTEPTFESEILFYPNPAVQGMNIFISPSIDLSNSSLTFYNVNGKKTFQKENLTSNDLFINISSFSGGIYFYRFLNKSGVNLTGKFIVK